MSATVLIAAGDARALFTWDLGRGRHSLLLPPANPSAADLMVIESYLVSAAAGTDGPEAGTVGTCSTTAALSESRWVGQAGAGSGQGATMAQGAARESMAGARRSGVHPAVHAFHVARRADAQLRVADAITAFAGSMTFVYLHGAVFATWMVVVEGNPWPTLTLVVSLEAIFLSTFVMIGQNRQAALQRAKADHDFVEQELELKTNTELTRAIHVLTAELHRRLLDDTPDDAGVAS